MNKIPYSHINVMVMPTDYCNMNCVYCFNDRKSNKKDSTMSLETLNRIFKITIPFYQDIRFIWHGGEPLSLGVEFYEKALALQKNNNPNNALIRNSVQSNLTLLDDHFAEFLVKNEFGVGGSFDGLHNEQTRHNTERILSGHTTLVKHGGKNGFICVVQRHNIDHLIEDYKWFNQNHLNYSLNDYLSEGNEDDPLFVPEEEYIKKICELFDYWICDKTCEISLSTFEMFVEYILLKKKDLCCYTSCLGKYIAVQHDGSIYNCNRTFSPKYCYGNVHEYSDIHECFQSRGFELMLKESIERRKQCIAQCGIFDFCAGGCSSCASVSGEISKPNQYVCNKQKGVYSYINSVLSELKEREISYLFDQINPRLLPIFEEYKLSTLS